MDRSLDPVTGRVLVPVVAEVAGAFSGSRHDGGPGSVGNFAKPVFGDEEEGFVLAVVELRDADRTTEGETKIVVAVLADGDLVEIVVVAVRVEKVVAEVFVRTAVNIVCA